MIEKKKSKKADLENKKVIFIEIGLIIALAALLGSAYSSWRKASLSAVQQRQPLFHH